MTRDFFYLVSGEIAVGAFGLFAEEFELVMIHSVSGNMLASHRHVFQRRQQGRLAELIRWSL